MSVTAGSRLGPYDNGAPLGAGAMGAVFRATDTRLKRQVAIKVLPQALAADPDRLARLQREAEMLASLSHPHIAVVYGLEESGRRGSAVSDRRLRPQHAVPQGSGRCEVESAAVHVAVTEAAGEEVQ